jgi:D-3-phosphoglycerate dehydrogenase
MPFKVMITMHHVAGDKEECRKIGGELFTIPCYTEDEVIAATHNADAVITGMECPVPFTRKVISKLEKCRVIHNTGAGYERIDVPAATDYGICVSYPGDYCAEEVAEHTMALLLACARRILRLDKAVRQGNWGFPARHEMTEIWMPMFQLTGQTLGIIGFGRIGHLIVPKAKGFGLRVIAYDPYVPANVFKESGVESVTFDHLLEESDYISVNAALTEENRHLLGIEQFRKMKPTAYFINCARAELADEEALYTALANGYIAGAGLDMIKGEAISLDHPLLRLENVIFTAHSAWYSEHSIAEIKRRAYENIGRVFRGEWPKWFINPEVKEKFLERWGKAHVAKREEL